MPTAINENFLYVTRKELFYAAFMLHIRKLINVVYDFPADDIKFNQELNEAKSSLRRKNLLTESARTGVTLDFSLSVCAAFCSEPESCEVVNSNEYYATIYNAGGMHMLLEQRSEDDLAAVWFLNEENLKKYVDSKINSSESNDNSGKGVNNDGKS